MTGDEESDQPLDLTALRDGGHEILTGRLGTIPVTVVITPYAQRRMRQRDIDTTEILEALHEPPSSHRSGRTRQRYEVAGMTNRGRLRVVYERPARDVVLVITTYPERG